MLKKASIFIIFVIAVLTSIYLLAVYKNNEDINSIDKKTYKVHLEKSISWLQNNQQDILLEKNSMLWWMIYEANKLSHDSRLTSLLQLYFKQYPKIKSTIWGPLFNGQKVSFIDSFSLSSFPYYNQHFIYSLHCDADLVKDLAIIAEQNESDFCHQANYFYRPACITHQLMGINFLNQNRCHYIDGIKRVTSDLQQDIVNQLTWDVRVVDVYLQRVMMLLITKAQDQVKPIWVQQILDHQLKDGGWGDFDALFNLWGNRSLGLSAKIISIGSEKSTFHATAQGVYLLTLLLNNNS